MNYTYSSSHGLNILFFLRTSKIDSATGQGPIYIRLTVGVRRNEISAKHSIEPRAVARTGVDLTQATTRHYRVTEGKVRTFLKHQHRRSDIPLTQLNHRRKVAMRSGRRVDEAGK